MSDLNLDATIAVDEATVTAARNTLARTAHRNHATSADLQTALAAVFGPMLSLPTPPLSRMKSGTPLSPADKVRVLELIEKGWDNHAIADTVGCSIQSLGGFRGSLVRAKHDAERRLAADA